MGIPNRSAPTQLAQLSNRAAVGPEKDPFLPLRPQGRNAGAVGPYREGGGGADASCGGALTRERAFSLLFVRLVRTGIRSKSDLLRVLGGRGALEDEEDLPELSDSGDEAAWEDENDADLPHHKQQTPCLFCDRFVHLSAKASAQRCPGLVGLCGLLIWSGTGVAHLFIPEPVLWRVC